MIWAMWPRSPKQPPFPKTAQCLVTRPNGSTPPNEFPNRLQYGNGALWTDLWPDGTVLIPPDNVGADGRLFMKWPWWRRERGQPLTIEGRRLDGPAPPLGADIPEGYDELYFQATGLIFPTEGCWEVTGRAGDASLTFVVLVLRVEEATPAAGLPGGSRADLGVIFGQGA